MNHSMIVKKSLKYLNRVFAVLMVVVVSLNIEQIFHNKRIQNFDHIRNTNSILRSKIYKCESCQTEGFWALTRLNSKSYYLDLKITFFFSRRSFVIFGFGCF